MTSLLPVSITGYNSRKNGNDASDRIRDIEEGVDQANIEIIPNPKEGIKRVWNIIKSTKEEVLIMFSSVNARTSPIRDGWAAIIKRSIREE